MKKLLGAAALVGAAYAGLAAYAAKQGREVGDVAGDVVNRATDAAERAADRLMAFAESLTEAEGPGAEGAGADGPAVVDLTDDADVRGAASGDR